MVTHELLKMMEKNSGTALRLSSSENLQAALRKLNDIVLSMQQVVMHIKTLQVLEVEREKGVSEEERPQFPPHA